jgi:hypothetical protein
MLSKQLRILDHMTCKCGKHPRLTETSLAGEPRYYVEAVCCKTTTVMLRSEQRAINEFQRIRGTQAHDDAVAPTLDNIVQEARDKFEQGRVYTLPRGLGKA